MEASRFDELFYTQYRRYPLLEAQDLVKALYQSVFGCGHFVGEAGWQYLEDELRTIPQSEDVPLVEPVGSDYCRVHIAALKANGLEPDTLFRLFRLTSQEPAGSMDTFLEGLARLEELIADGSLPLDARLSSEFIAGYRAKGCPATHHSDAFRAAYSPAYRVVSAAMCRYLPLICRADRERVKGGIVNIAIEGGSASGKTSLAALMNELYDCNIFHMDDFFLQPHQRTPERFAQPGGNVDYERFASEIAANLNTRKPFEYQVFDCSVMALGEKVQVTPKQLNVVEGAYSMHPALRDVYTFSVFLESDPEVQKARILRRNGEKMLTRFVNEWIPLEHVYFDSTGAREACSIVIPAPEK